MSHGTLVLLSLSRSGQHSFNTRRELLPCRESSGASLLRLSTQCFAGAFLEVFAWQQDLNSAPLKLQRSCGKVSGDRFNQLISIFPAK